MVIGQYGKCHSMGVRMKKVMKRFIALLCVFVLAMSFTACKSSTKDNTSKTEDKKEDLSSVDAKKVLQDAYKKMADQKSSKANMTLKMDMSVKEKADAEAEDLKIDANIAVASSQEPLAASITGDASGDISGTAFNGKAELYFVTEGDKPMVYVGFDIGTGMTWMYLDMKDMVSMKDLKSAFTSDGSDSSLDMFSSLKVEAVEKVNNKDCYKIVGNFDKAALDKVLDTKQNGTTMRESMEKEYGKDVFNQMMKMFDDFNLPITFYVAKDGSTFEKCSCEMSETIKALVAGVSKAVGESAGDLKEMLTVNAASFDITYANGETAEIKVPDEAKTNAIDGSTLLDSVLGSASSLQK